MFRVWGLGLEEDGNCTVIFGLGLGETKFFHG